MASSQAHIDDSFEKRLDGNRLSGVFCSQDVLAMLEQILTWPMSCKMKVDLSCGTHNARTDFEQTNANRIRTCLRQDGIGQDLSSKIRHQQRRDRVQLEPDSIRTKAVTAQAIRIHAELQL